MIILDLLTIIVAITITTTIFPPSVQVGQANSSADPRIETLKPTYLNINIEIQTPAL